MRATTTSSANGISRRFFVKASVAATGGLMLGFHMPGARAAIIGPKPQATTTAVGTEINAWLVIDKDNKVTIRIPHTEFGQGGATSVALMVAEELNVDWSTITAEWGDANRHLRNNNEYKTMFTSGSRLVAAQHPHLMGAGASARERLKQAAADAWGVKREDVIAKLGVLTSGEHSGTYGEFAEAAAQIKLDKEPEINEDPATWWLMGKPHIQRLDIPHKVNGKAQFAIDTELPGMVYAAVKASPVPWGTLKSYDFEKIRKLPGIITAVPLKAVPGKVAQSDLQDAVAVIADSWWRAKNALELLPIEWDFGENANASTASYYADAHALLDQPGTITGNVDPKAAEIIAASSKVVAASYERPFEAHARMEPVNATAWVQDDRVDVWSPVQDQSTAVIIAADQSGYDSSKVYANTTFIGGAFGGNGPGGTAVTRQATEISKQLKRPVKVIWTREEDIGQGKQRPLVAAKFAASLGANGLPEAFHARVVGFHSPAFPFVIPPDIGIATGMPGMHGMDFTIPYQIAHRQCERHSPETNVPITTHRAPGVNQSIFMMESFVDEMAIAGGWDPLEWRLKMTEGTEDVHNVAKLLKEKAGFRTDLPKGKGMGIALTQSHGTIVGMCASVTVSREGRLDVEKVIMVVDAGRVINPNAAAEQCEGSVVWELSHAWTGGLEFEDGQFKSNNFHSYNLLRFNQAPRVETIFASSGGKRWGGIGETPSPPAAAAVANAIWYATGKRLRSTPFHKHDLSWT